MKIRIIVASILATLSGCAATYVGPTIIQAEMAHEISAPKQVLMRAVKQVFVAEGYQITQSDDDAGIVSTATKPTRLTPEQADCGTTMGIDYLKDNRTTSTVALGAVVSNNRVMLRTTISASYLPGHLTQSIQMDCVSRGQIEGALLAKIEAAAR